MIKKTGMNKGIESDGAKQEQSAGRGLDLLREFGILEMETNSSLSIQQAIDNVWRKILPEE